MEKKEEIIILNETLGLLWTFKTICLLVCLLVTVPGIAIALIFNDFISIGDTAIYCLTAICIASIIGCIVSIIGYFVVFQNFIRDSKADGKDS